LPWIISSPDLPINQFAEVQWFGELTTAGGLTKEWSVMITTFRYRTEEKGLGGLFERFPKSKNPADAPPADSNGIPISEPDSDNPSVPPASSDRPWLV
jgi:hypothetical protein